MKRSCAAALAALLLLNLSVACASAAPRVQIRALDPYTAMCVQFLGGSFVESKSYSAWGHEALKLDTELMKTDEASPPAVIALNENQYRRFLNDFRREGRRVRWFFSRSADQARSEIRWIYSLGEVDAADVVHFYGELSNLPFTVQRIMGILTDMMPDKYSYFQRRLGEFDARLRSTLLSGRKLLSGRAVLDLGGAYSGFLKALGCKISLPDAELTDEILASASSKNAKTVKILREKIWKDPRVYVMDHTTPREIRDALKGRPRTVYIAPPTEKDDPLFFLHRLALLIGTAAPDKRQ